MFVVGGCVDGGSIVVLDGVDAVVVGAVVVLGVDVLVVGATVDSFVVVGGIVDPCGLVGPCVGAVPKTVKMLKQQVQMRSQLKHSRSMEV